ncbi:MAG: DUF4135 domain-containing protein [Candidatus Omnitrophica bacterium]|nr:DUF4135 domain-containing protein [Candidatus Omnitrophota bacterium]
MTGIVSILRTQNTDLAAFPEFLDANNPEYQTLDKVRQRENILQKVANDTGIAIGYCYKLRSGLRCIYYTMLRPHEKSVTYCKNSWTEDRLFIFRGLRIGILICFEAMQTVEALICSDEISPVESSLRDVDLVFIPSATCEIGDVLLNSKFIRKQWRAQVILLNLIGGLGCPGGSHFIDSRGSVLSLNNNEAILMADIQPKVSTILSINASSAAAPQSQDSASSSKISSPVAIMMAVLPCLAASSFSKATMIILGVIIVWLILTGFPTPDTTNKPKAQPDSGVLRRQNKELRAKMVALFSNAKPDAQGREVVPFNLKGVGGGVYIYWNGKPRVVLRRGYNIRRPYLDVLTSFSEPIERIFLVTCLETNNPVYFALDSDITPNLISLSALIGNLSASKSLPRPLILLVEPYYATRQVFGELLRYNGFEVIAVNDLALGREWVLGLEKHNIKIDLIISEVFFPPALESVGAKKFIRWVKIEKGYKVLILTGVLEVPAWAQDVCAGDILKKNEFDGYVLEKIKSALCVKTDSAAAKDKGASSPAAGRGQPLPLYLRRLAENLWRIDYINYESWIEDFARAFDKPRFWEWRVKRLICADGSDSLVIGLAEDRVLKITTNDLDWHYDLQRRRCKFDAPVLEAGELAAGTHRRGKMIRYFIQPLVSMLNVERMSQKELNAFCSYVEDCGFNWAHEIHYNIGRLKKRTGSFSAGAIVLIDPYTVERKRGWARKMRNVSSPATGAKNKGVSSPVPGNNYSEPRNIISRAFLNFKIVAWGSVLFAPVLIAALFLGLYKLLMLPQIMRLLRKMRGSYLKTADFYNTKWDQARLLIHRLGNDYVAGFKGINTKDGSVTEPLEFSAELFYKFMGRWKRYFAERDASAQAIKDILDPLRVLCRYIDNLPKETPLSVSIFLFDFSHKINDFLPEFESIFQQPNPQNKISKRASSPAQPGIRQLKPLDNLRPPSRIFNMRILRELNEGFFDKKFGEPVELYSVQHAGDLHAKLHLKLGKPGSPVKGSNIISLPVQFIYHLDLAGKVNFIASDKTLNIAAGKQSISKLSRLEIDRVGMELLLDNLIRGGLVIDSTKLLVFRGTNSGHEYRVIYKAFDAVRLEAEITWFLGRIGLPTYEIITREDEFGGYGWVEYIEHFAMDSSEARNLFGGHQLRQFARQLILQYVLGNPDLHQENFLVEKCSSHNLIHIDHETAFTDWAPDLLLYLGFFAMTMPDHFPPFIIKYLNQKAFHSEILSAVEEFCGNRTFAEDLFSLGVKTVRGNFCYRKIMRNTAFYRETILGQRGFIPYYESTLFEENLVRMMERYMHLHSFLALRDPLKEIASWIELGQLENTEASTGRIRSSLAASSPVLIDPEIADFVMEEMFLVHEAIYWIRDLGRYRREDVPLAAQLGPDATLEEVQILYEAWIEGRARIILAGLHLRNDYTALFLNLADDLIAQFGENMPAAGWFKNHRELILAQGPLFFHRGNILIPRDLAFHYIQKTPGIVRYFVCHELFQREFRDLPNRLKSVVEKEVRNVLLVESSTRAISKRLIDYYELTPGSPDYFEELITQYFYPSPSKGDYFNLSETGQVSLLSGKPISMTAAAGFKLGYDLKLYFPQLREINEVALEKVSIALKRIGEIYREHVSSPAVASKDRVSSPIVDTNRRELRALEDLRAALTKRDSNRISAILRDLSKEGWAYARNHIVYDTVKAGVFISLFKNAGLGYNRIWAILYYIYENHYQHAYYGKALKDWRYITLWRKTMLDDGRVSYEIHVIDGGIGFDIAKYVKSSRSTRTDHAISGILPRQLNGIERESADSYKASMHIYSRGQRFDVRTKEVKREGKHINGAHVALKIETAMPPVKKASIEERPKQVASSPLGSSIENTRASGFAAEGSQIRGSSPVAPVLMHHGSWKNRILVESKEQRSMVCMRVLTQKQIIEQGFAIRAVASLWSWLDAQAYHKGFIVELADMFALAAAMKTTCRTNIPYASRVDYFAALTDVRQQLFSIEGILSVYPQHSLGLIESAPWNRARKHRLVGSGLICHALEGIWRSGCRTARMDCDGKLARAMFQAWGFDTGFWDKEMIAGYLKKHLQELLKGLRKHGPPELLESFTLHIVSSRRANSPVVIDPKELLGKTIQYKDLLIRIQMAEGFYFDLEWIRIRFKVFLDRYYLGDLLAVKQRLLEENKEALRLTGKGRYGDFTLPTDKIAHHILTRETAPGKLWFSVSVNTPDYNEHYICGSILKTTVSSPAAAPSQNTVSSPVGAIVITKTRAMALTRLMMVYERLMRSCERDVKALSAQLENAHLTHMERLNLFQRQEKARVGVWSYQMAISTIGQDLGIVSSSPAAAATQDRASSPLKKSSRVKLAQPRSIAKEKWMLVNWDAQLVAALMQLEHPSLPKFRKVRGGEGYEIRIIPGMNMEVWSCSSGRLSDHEFEKQIILWLIQIAEVLQLLHRSGIIHGDVSPRNIVIDENTNQPVLIDFDDYATDDLEGLISCVSIALIARLAGVHFKGRGFRLEELNPVLTDGRFARQLVEIRSLAVGSIEEFIAVLKTVASPVAAASQKGASSPLKKDSGVLNFVAPAFSKLCSRVSPGKGASSPLKTGGSTETGRFGNLTPNQISIHTDIISRNLDLLKPVFIRSKIYLENFRIEYYEYASGMPRAPPLPEIFAFLINSDGHFKVILSSEAAKIVEKEFPGGELKFALSEIFIHEYVEGSWIEISPATAHQKALQFSLGHPDLRETAFKFAKIISKLPKNLLKMPAHQLTFRVYSSLSKQKTDALFKLIAEDEPEYSFNLKAIRQKCDKEWFKGAKQDALIAFYAGEPIAFLRFFMPFKEEAHGGAEFISTAWRHPSTSEALLSELLNRLKVEGVKVFTVQSSGRQINLDSHLLPRLEVFIPPAPPAAAAQQEVVSSPTEDTPLISILAHKYEDIIAERE